MRAMRRTTFRRQVMASSEVTLTRLWRGRMFSPRPPQDIAPFQGLSHSDIMIFLLPEYNRELRRPVATEFCAVDAAISSLRH